MLLMKNLKAIVLAVIVASLIAASASATMPFRFGGNVGISIANQNFDYSSPIEIEFDYIAGFAIGVTAAYQVSDMLAVSPRLQYVQKGYQDEIILTSEGNPASTGTETFKERISYLSIPVLAKITPVPVSVLQPYALAGPRLDIKLGESFDIATGLEDSLKSVVFGLSLGAGVEHTLGNGGTVTLEGIYHLDLTKSVSIENLDVTNRAFVIQVGYLFR